MLNVSCKCLNVQGALLVCKDIIDIPSTRKRKLISKLIF